jgi:hypothetical protein
MGETGTIVVRTQNIVEHVDGGGGIREGRE